MTRQDFLDWKQHPVTKEVFHQLQNRIRLMQEALGDMAGENPSQDRYQVGAIQAYKDIVLMEIEDDEESQ